MTQILLTLERLFCDMGKLKGFNNALLRPREIRMHIILNLTVFQSGLFITSNLAKFTRKLRQLKLTVELTMLGSQMVNQKSCITLAQLLNNLGIRKR